MNASLAASMRICGANAHGRLPESLGHTVATVRHRAADVQAFVRESGSASLWKMLLKQLGLDDHYLKGWRWLRDRRPYIGGGALFFFGADTPRLDRSDLVLEVPNNHHPDIIALAPELQPDLSAEYDTPVIRGGLLRIGRLGMANMHGGLSPESRGADCTFCVLYKGAPKKVGCTLHWVAAGGLFADVWPEDRPDDYKLRLFWLAVQTSADANAELVQRLAAGECFGQRQPSKARLCQVKQRELRQVRVVGQRLKGGPLRNLDLGARVRRFPVTCTAHGQSVQ